VVAIHPLWGKRIADEFSVKPGHACVMLSRHRSHLSLLIDDQAAAVLCNGDQEDENVRLASTVLTDMLGTVHGGGQAITLDTAWRTQTINAATTLHREHLVGSITPGKLADFVELTADPWTVAPEQLIDQVQVAGTWLGGQRVDLDAFLSAVGGADNAAHSHLAARRVRGCC
jgi:adenine deaminase